MTTQDDELTLQYQLLIEENEINPKSLPSAIRNKIKAIIPTLTRYNNKPSESLLVSIKKMDGALFHLISDWIEQGLPTEDEYVSQQGNQQTTVKVDPKPKVTPTPDPVVQQTPAPVVTKSPEDLAKEQELEKLKQKAKEEQEAKDREAKEKADKEKAVADQLAKIKEVMSLDRDKRISAKKLEEILGKKPESPVTIGELKLKSVWMNSAYFEKA